VCVCVCVEGGVCLKWLSYVCIVCALNVSGFARLWPAHALCPCHYQWRFLMFFPPYWTWMTAISKRLGIIYIIIIIRLPKGTRREITNLLSLEWNHFGLVLHPNNSEKPLPLRAVHFNGSPVNVK
jgi:hypothetical protein